MTFAPSTGILKAAFDEKYHVPDRTPEIQTRMELDLIGDLASMLQGTKAKEVILYGYTPSFNDGDPCVHINGDVVINGLDYWGGLPSDVRCEFGLPDRDEDRERDEDEEILFKELATERAICDKIDHRLEDVFGTNWGLKITLVPGGAEYERCDYWPEY